MKLKEKLSIGIAITMLSQIAFGEEGEDIETSYRYLSDGSVELIQKMPQSAFEDFLKQGSSKESPEGLKRKKYLVTCHKKGANNSVISWVEKGYSSVLVHPVAAAGCMAKVGDPSHSLRKL